MDRERMKTFVHRMGLEYGGVKMAGYFFVTGMTVIEFPDGIQWNERAKPTFTGALAELLLP